MKINLPKCKRTKEYCVTEESRNLRSVKNISLRKSTRWVYSEQDAIFKVWSLRKNMANMHAFNQLL